MKLRDGDLEFGKYFIRLDLAHFLLTLQRSEGSQDVRTSPHVREDCSIIARRLGAGQLA